jgi:hypothetical protein
MTLKFIILDHNTRMTVDENSGNCKEQNMFLMQFQELWNEVFYSPMQCSVEILFANKLIKEIRI